MRRVRVSVKICGRERGPSGVRGVHSPCERYSYE